MTARMIHIPGELGADGVQRCTRCGTLMNHGSNPSMSWSWQVGVTVSSGRGGMSVVDDPEMLATIRPCGRPGAWGVNIDPNTGAVSTEVEDDIEQARRTR